MLNKTKADTVYDWIMENVFGWFAVGALIILMIAMVGVVALIAMGLGQLIGVVT